MGRGQVAWKGEGEEWGQARRQSADAQQRVAGPEIEGKGKGKGEA